MPTPPQRGIIAAADPTTGLLDGPQRSLEALASQNLAWRHPKPPHRYYLTPAGQRLRAQLDEPAPQPKPPAAPEETSATFRAHSGDTSAPEDSETRSRKVATAWAGILEMRRISSPGGQTGLLSPWELRHLVDAAALALEASGATPAYVDAAGVRINSGYRVTDTAQDDAVSIHWTAADDRAAQTDGSALAAYTETLERSGWQVTEHQQRDNERYLLASPRRRAQRR